MNTEGTSRAVLRLAWRGFLSIAFCQCPLRPAEPLAYRANFSPQPTAQKALRSVRDDGRVFLFDASDSRLRELTESKVMLLEPLTVRRVIAVLKQSSQIAVATGSAALTDFFQEGDVQFTLPIDFKPHQALVIHPFADRNGIASLESWLVSGSENRLPLAPVAQVADDSRRTGDCRASREVGRRRTDVFLLEQLATPD